MKVKKEGVTYHQNKKKRLVRVLLDGREHWCWTDNHKGIPAKRLYDRVVLHVSEEGKGYYFNYDVAPDMFLSRSEAVEARPVSDTWTDEKMAEMVQLQDDMYKRLDGGQRAL